jgi:hypothetical protein
MMLTRHGALLRCKGDAIPNRMGLRNALQRGCRLKPIGTCSNRALNESKAIGEGEIFRIQNDGEDESLVCRIFEA